MKKIEYRQTGFHEQSWGNQKVHEWAETTMSCIRILEKKSVSGWNLKATSVWKSETSALSVRVFKWPNPARWVPLTCTLDAQIRSWIF